MSLDAVDTPPTVFVKSPWSGLGDQYCAGYSVAQLIALTEGLPVFHAPVAAFLTSYDLCDEADLRDFVAHMRKVLAADLSFPIILGPNGAILDGKHRLAKAIFLEEPTILAVRLLTLIPLPPIPE